MKRLEQLKIAREANPAGHSDFDPAFATRSRSDALEELKERLLRETTWAGIGLSQLDLAAASGGGCGIAGMDDTLPAAGVAGVVLREGSGGACSVRTPTGYPPAQPPTNRARRSMITSIDAW
jgi:hypothetical protein